MSTLQRPTGDMIHSKVAPPITMLPAELQKSVRWFCGFYFETLKGTAAIAHRFRWWMEEEGLTLAEAKDAMRELMRPERAADIDTAPKVVAVLACEVARIIRDRREKERTARLQGNGVAPEAADVERMKQLLANRMNPETAQ